MSKHFPENFLWGSATASYQVEGGIENNDWAQGAREGQVPVCGLSSDHYHRFESDFDIVQSLGHNSHRFSIEWARIEPEEGKFDEKEIEHYLKVLQALNVRNITPVVTLWHFTLPLWFYEKGGFMHKDGARVFARYCAYVVEKLGNEANMWVTINEPLIWASQGFLKRNWPPYRRNFFSFLSATSALIRAHKLAYTAIKSVSATALVGIAKHNMYFYADSFAWNRFAVKCMVWFWNIRFLDAIDQFQDFVGLNFYITKKFGKKDTFIQTEMGWDINPAGLYQCLLELKKYKKPIYILENGLADQYDVHRAVYVRGHIESVKRAMKEGVDVRGYFHWSLLDNFEWSFGFSRRFGLVEIDYQTLERTVRPSAHVYKEIIEKGIL